MPLRAFSELHSSVRRIVFGGTILGCTFVGAVLGYRLFGYDWIGAVWLTVITISSVGYGERSAGSPAFQLFTVAVILVGISAAAYTFGGLLNLMTQGEIERALKRRRMTSDIERLIGHTIVCGYGRMGQLVAESLRHRGRPLVILDNDDARLEAAEAQGFLVLAGDATEDASLLSAGLKRAKALVTCLPGDAENVFITLTARNFCPTLQIVARAEHTTTERKLRQAGADRVVLPTAVGAKQMVRMLTRPTTADLMDLLAETSVLDVDLDEFEIGGDSRLAGTPIGQIDPERKYRLLVLAVKKTDGQMTFNPEEGSRIEPGDTLIVIGAPERIGAFRKDHGI